MRTSLVGGIDVGTRRIRAVAFDCSTRKVLAREAKGKEEVLELIRFLKGIGVEKLCVAGGLQWRELNGIEIYRDPVSLLGSERDIGTHGFRKLISSSIFKEVVILPSGGASGEVPIWNLFNAVDSGTPDKVAKCNYLINSEGLSDFTLIDDGCFTSILKVNDKAITFVLGSTRGVPGRCTPGCIDSEIFIAFKWPQRKKDLLECGAPREVVEGWIRFLKPVLGDTIIYSSELDEWSAAIGSALWCCGTKPKNFFSDTPRYFCDTLKALMR
ncbi:hypothetical protein EYM_04735 [Ignicoccus islandicus DSM 13165]|uniref:Uncharacterized protein n=1 Tax=Ignicoccus islandicus DSM 13165 TaxID=940295 RepID=A0A0U2VET2_9CREN|nr:DUF1464 family protein [Ignicoccus islandicus]ALU12514.1 hypothetical protein EYM_04735 [Ignicoccus islandicus DSM 13165]